MKNTRKLLIISLFFIFTGFAKAQDLRFYRVDTLSGKVYWQCDKHNGIIKLKDGGFVIDEKGHPIAGKFLIDMHSIKDLDMDVKQFGTAVMILENTLKNEFFEVEQYPYAIFELESVKLLDVNYYELTGDFTMHGITNCISFKAHIDIDQHQLVMKSDTFSIDRTDWGVYRMSPKRPYSDDENGWTVPDQINLKIDLTAKLE